ncbi:efflux RND transporter periplasmic adaptor subunit [Alkaliphilus pronyensis]|uniref:Efflux RND transporter periplasmic adaptor subunit n=1 Tax=Alkaliphilus pronyensis TaxID=1482732 RepID=A0A6I0FHX6_9FIRM|nr:efflux RND transporter periplasmic adaptor subunit [Alkaliphilus pronyensis]KAB3535771.1 efflux RND transporter periplasmic adaptor subunit [Alkaliphilus pronyensis]
MKIKKIVAIFLTLLIIVAIVVGCGSKQQEEVTLQLTPVETYSIKEMSIQNTHNSYGSIKPLTEVSIIPKLAGKVEKVLKNVGDKVNKDEILLTIEKTSYYQQLEQLDAQLQQQLIQAEAAMKQAEIQYSISKQDYENNKALYEAQAVSQQMLESYNKAFNLAELQYKNAQDNYYLLQNKVLVGIDENNTQLMGNTKSVLETQKDAVYQMITDSEVKSPISGVVAIKNAEVGEIVSQQIPAFTIIDIDKVIIETSVTEKMINNIEKGQEIVVTIEALDRMQFNAIVDTISPAKSGQGTGYSIKKVIDNQHHQIKPGMFAEVSFVIDNRDNALLVPLEAVLTDDDEGFVFILKDDNTVIKQPVATGYKNAEYIEITNGVKKGDKVVVKGQHFIVDGEKVQPVGGVQ